MTDRTKRRVNLYKKKDAEDAQAASKAGRGGAGSPQRLSRKSSKSEPGKSEPRRTRQSKVPYEHSTGARGTVPDIYPDDTCILMVPEGFQADPTVQPSQYSHFRFPLVPFDPAPRAPPTLASPPSPHWSPQKSPEQS